MLIEAVSGKVEGKLAKLRISHGTQESFWDGGIYDRTSFGDLSSLFKEINGYWSTLSLDAQQKVYECYARIMEVLDTVTVQTRLKQRLRGIVKELYDLHDLTAFRQWVLFNGDIKIPVSMRDTYDVKDIESWTYLRDEYQELMILAVQLRPMVPIFGEYIERISKEVGTNHKEEYALGLIVTSKLQDLPAMKRFRRYVDARVEQEPVPVSAVLKSLGSTELPRWMLAKTLVRRVAVGEVNVLDDKSSIISNVHHFIVQNLKSMDRNFDGKITEKRSPTEGTDEDNMSLIETHKVKQEQPDGDLVMLSVYTENIEDTAVKVDPTIDFVKLQLCCATTQQLEMLEVGTHHLALVQWTLKKAISARAIPSLNKPALLRALGVTQSLLWHWGFPELAALATAAPVPTHNKNLLMSVESRVRIPNQLIDQLVESYPYFRRENSKTQNERQANVAVRAIEILAREMSRNDWYVYVPAQLRDAITLQPGTNVMITPADIKAQLARLLLFMKTT